MNLLFAMTQITPLCFSEPRPDVLSRPYLRTSCCHYATGAPSARLVDVPIYKSLAPSMLALTLPRRMQS